MIRRRQLPVASRISVGALARGLAATVRPPARTEATTVAAVTRTLLTRYRANHVTLLDSGTSALVAALRIVAGPQRTVAYPAFACVDLIAAARLADVRVRLYDIDPVTLSPDLDSLCRTLADGVDAIVVAHLFGFPADVASVRVVADQFGVPIIEDAAQRAGATLHGARAGGLGDVSILSFGRGKGITAGTGGALLSLDKRWNEPVTQLGEQLAHHRPAPGVGAWVGATASWLVGRPAIYTIPASIPALHLGETVYHDAHEPAPLSAAAAAILRVTLSHADQDALHRRRIAATLREAVLHSTHLRACTPVAAGVSGYLRFPVVADPPVAPIPRLGIVRSYPRTLAEQSELQPLLLPSAEPFYGAQELATRLLTLPTHHMVTAGDLRQLTAWLRTT
jgi:dTDP-4-amino-4,6-dideoxygalactose transaminase